MVGRTHTSILPAAALALLLGAPATTAQQTQQPASDEVALQCMSDLVQFGQEIAAEGFWVSGWGFSPGFGWAAGVDPGVPPAAGPVPPAATARAPQDPAIADPWGGLAGVEPSPRYDIRVLHLAAEVLARRGDEEGCQYLLAQMQQAYQTYSAQLQEAGIDSAVIADWRHEQIALAQPVAELPETLTLTVDHFIGADVRNVRDEYLGSVSDVIIDRTDHTIQYIVVARGGFLGVGEDLIPVPWERFSLAAGLHTLVLDVTASGIAAAPQAETGVNGPLFDEVDRYWAS